MTSQEIKTQRQTLNLTQAEFADFLGISTNLVAQMEVGSKPVSARTEKTLIGLTTLSSPVTSHLELICFYLKKTHDYLAGHDHCDAHGSLDLVMPSLVRSLHGQTLLDFALDCLKSKFYDYEGWLSTFAPIFDRIGEQFYDSSPEYVEFLEKFKALAAIEFRHKEYCLAYQMSYLTDRIKMR